MMLALVMGATLTVAQATANLKQAIASVNGKLQFEITLQGRIYGDYKAGNSKGMATDIAKQTANSAALAQAWVVYEKAFAAYRALVPFKAPQTLGAPLATQSWTRPADPKPDQTGVRP